MTDEVNGGGKAGLLTVRQLVNEAKAEDPVLLKRRTKGCVYDAVIGVLAKKNYSARAIEQWLAARGHKVSAWMIRASMKRNKKRYAEVEAELAAVTDAPAEPAAAEAPCACQDGECKPKD